MFFKVLKKGNKLEVINQYNISFTHISIYMDGHYYGTCEPRAVLEISLNRLPKIYEMTIDSYFIANAVLYRKVESFLLLGGKGSKRTQEEEEVDYQAGDILIASDNVGDFPSGYVGHSAIVVDDKHIIESVASSPIVRKVPIQDFIKDHPIHAHYRPKSKEKGKDAANYAIKYLEEFKEKKKNQSSKPLFLFTIETPLKDEWTYIYCSKLVWLSYYYGADYQFENDHLWFSPQDLYQNLKDNNEFKLIKKHQDFKYYLDS